jgi:hypothetical protein
MEHEYLLQHSEELSSCPVRFPVLCVGFLTFLIVYG